MAIFVLVVMIVAAVAPLGLTIALHAGSGGKRPAPYGVVAGTLFAAALMAGLLGYGGASDWGGCDAEGEHGVVTCVRGEEHCSVREWDTTCPPHSGDAPHPACAGTAPDGNDSLCAAGYTPAVAYCEAFSEGWIKQPINTWSGLGFLVCGLWVLFVAWLDTGRTNTPEEQENPMFGRSFDTTLYAFVLILVGPGTVALHASMKNWGGWADTWTIGLWLVVAHTYSVTRWFRMKDGWRVVWLLGTLLAWGAGLGWLTWDTAGTRQWVAPVFGGLWGGTELITWIWHTASDAGVNRKFTREVWWFWCLLGAFVAAFIFWGLWVPGNDACDPASPFQGHALWHVCAAIAGLLAFFMWRSERVVDA